MSEKKQWITVSFSGGKDSTAMLLRMIELGEHIDEVVCCDTYKEFPAMYRHVDKVKHIVDSKGIKFTTLRNDKTFDYFMFEHEVKRKNSKFSDNRGYSWAGSMQRWCTSKLKTDIINRYFGELNSQYNVIQCVGIAADEQYRLQRQSNRDKRLPLVEWGWSEQKCLSYCYSLGFDWEGLYKLFSRVSCWCCPLQSLSDLRNLKRHFPELWSELKDMDNRTWRQFRADYSVEQLDIRFVLEDEREKNGLTTNARSKEFRTALAKRFKEQ